jgi:hypothetical protein
LESAGLAFPDNERSMTHPAILVAMSELMTVGFVYGVFRIAGATDIMQTGQESLMKKTDRVKASYRTVL